jgi:hypothetical protein
VKQVTELPEWFVILPQDARISARDVANLFGFKGVGSFYVLVTQGSFPAADCSSKSIFSGRGKTAKRCFWSKKVILEEINRRKVITNATSRD